LGDPTLVASLNVVYGNNITNVVSQYNVRPNGFLGGRVTGRQTEAWLNIDRADAAFEKHIEPEFHVNCRTIHWSAGHMPNFIDAPRENFRQSFGRFIDVVDACQSARINFYGCTSVSHTLSMVWRPFSCLIRPLPAVATAGRQARLVGTVFPCLQRAQFRYYQRQAFLAGLMQLALHRFQLAADSGELGAALVQQLVLIRHHQRAHGFGDFELRVRGSRHGAFAMRQRRFHGACPLQRANAAITRTRY
jgi:hypothetical protein